MEQLTITISEPNEKQKLFLSDTHKYVAFGGARGGGKSWAVRVKAILLAFNYPGIKLCIIRQTYGDLISNHVDPLIEALPRGSYRYNDGKKQITFPNGSKLSFRYCVSENDISRFQGVEYDVVFIDEATQFSEQAFRMIAASVRGVNNYPKRIYLTCNPGGIGHGWVKRLFIDKNYNDKENPEDYSFTQSLVTDNKILMQTNPDYVTFLEALPPKQRQAWLEGRWDVFEGQFFEEFRDDPEHYKDQRYTHVIEPFNIPKGWTMYRSFDFGYAKPFSCAWWAVDYDGILYRILELYGCTGTPNEGVKWTPNQIFSEISKTEQTHPYLKGRRIYGVADPSIWDRSRGEAIVDMADRHSVSFEPGDNKRIPGWMQCHYRLAFDNNGYPRMYVFNTCRAFIRTIPLLQYDKTRVEDLDTDGEDHVADEWRYMAMLFKIVPQREPEPVSSEDAEALHALDMKPGDLQR